MLHYPYTALTTVGNGEPVNDNSIRWLLFEPLSACPNWELSNAKSVRIALAVADLVDKFDPDRDDDDDNEDPGDGE